MSLEKLNQRSWEVVRNYCNLEIAGQKVITPYFMNYVEGYFISLMRQAGISEELISTTSKLYKEKNVPYGWYRGKGTPSEIIQATIDIAESTGFVLKGSSASTIDDFMRAFGIGVDCSGFVYHVLTHAFSSIGEEKSFHDTLSWLNKENQGVTRAGAFVFAGSASDIITPEKSKAVDLILVKDSRGGNGYSHIAIILEEEGQLLVAHSTLSIAPAGIHIDTLENWKKFYENTKEIEFRRLKILHNK